MTWTVVEEGVQTDENPRDLYDSCYPVIINAIHSVQERNRVKIWLFYEVIIWWLPPSRLPPHETPHNLGFDNIGLKYVLSCLGVVAQLPQPGSQSWGSCRARLIEQLNSFFYYSDLCFERKRILKN